jgi:hypothetical protein
LLCTPKSVNTKAFVTAPASGSFRLRMTPVQEQVQWFDSRLGVFADAKVRVSPIPDES